MAKKVYIGNRDTLIEVVKYSEINNSIGEPEFSEVSIGNFWAHLQDASGNESLEGKVIHVNARHYTILYNSDIAAFGERMTVKDAGKEYNIFYVQLIGRKDQLLLKCQISE